MIEGKRLLPVFIYKILRRYSSRQHALSHADIKKYLWLDYDVDSIDSKTITRCLDDFENVGWPVHRNKRLGVYLSEVFTETELKVMMAPMFMASYLSNENISKLMLKIGKINERQRKNVKRNIAFASQYRHIEYDDFLGKIRTIDYAQDNHLQLQFVYNDIDENGRLAPRIVDNDKGIRIANPYGMVYVEGFFYFICSKDGSKKILNYRIDKMTNVVVLDTPAMPISQIPGYERGVFNPAEYVNRNFKMFNTEPVDVKFRIAAPIAKRLNFYINTVWDEFGNRVSRIKRVSDTIIEFSAKIPLLGAKIFALQYADVTEVLEPEELRAELRNIFKNNAKKYK